MYTVSGFPRKLSKTNRIKQFVYSQFQRLSFLPSPEKYNLTISHENKFVWFRVAKVGTRTIYNYFIENKISLDAEHPSFIYYPPQLYDEYFKFAFVRNPWDRLVSCWLDKVVYNNLFEFSAAELKQMQEFASFVDFVSTLNVKTCDRHLRLQSQLIDLNNLDYLGRLETFDRDFKQVLNLLGVKKNKITQKNVSKDRKPYHEYYNQELINKVLAIYKVDVQIFGYQF